MSHILLQQVLEFHKKYKRHIGDPRTPRIHDVDFRMRLLEEELGELEEALDDTTLTDKERIIKISDALGDMVYVLFGSAVCWGIDLAGVLDAIHTSNMTKSVDNLRVDGKVLKGPDYQPPEIKQALEDAASFVDQDGFDGDDAWWPPPSIQKAGVSFLPGQEEPPQEVSDKVMLAAREQAKLLAMKSITEDFVIDVDVEDEPTQPWEDDELSHPEACSCATCAPYTSTGVDVSSKNEVLGEMTSYGMYIFTCPCGRTHGAQAKLGSRGGLAPSAKAECMCGKAFLIDFSGLKPNITVTTIEEIRKVENV